MLSDIRDAVIVAALLPLTGLVWMIAIAIIAGFVARSLRK